MSRTKRWLTSWRAKAARAESLYLFAGLALVCMEFARLEGIESYYFNQDDNFAQFLPVILRGCRSLFWEGRFPDWLPNQALGLPASGLGVYSLTYPFTYFSYAIATYVLGDPAATLEVFFLLHACAGFTAVYFFLIRRSVRPFLALSAAHAYVFCGYHLIGGRSWYYMIPFILWSPLAVHLTLCLPARRSAQAVLLLAAVIGLSFHAGNIQMWIYLLGFCSLLAAFRIRAQGSATAVNYVAALMAGFAIAAPLLWVQSQLLAYSDRMGAWGGGIGVGWKALFLPYPLVQALHPNGWGVVGLKRAGHLYYGGTVFLVSAVIALAQSFLPDVRRHSPKAIKPLLVCLVFSFLYALGSAGFLWDWTARLPPFNRFTNPFKFLHFVHLFGTLGGCLALSDWLKNKNRWAERLVATIAFALVAYHIGQCRTSFFSYAARSYPPLPEAMGRALEGVQRVLPYGPTRSLSPSYPWSMMHNFASVYNLSSVFAYEPLLYSLPRWEWALRYDPHTLVKEYGVSHLLMTVPPRTDALPKYAFLETQAQKVLDLPTGRIYRMRSPTGLGALSGPRGERPVAVTEQTNGVQVSGLAEGDLILRYINDGRFEAWTPRGSTLRVYSDVFQRIRLRIPPGVEQVFVRYRPPWAEGFLLGLILAALSWMAMSYSAERRSGALFRRK